MSNRVAKIAGVLALAAGGFSVGWWGQQLLAPAGESMPKKDAAPSEPLPSRFVGALAPPAPDPKSEEAIDNSAAILDEAETRGERILPNRSVINLFSRQAISADGTLSDEVAELLQLTTTERAAANQAIATASERLQHLELARTELASASNTEVVFHVGPFQDEGEAVRTAFRQELLRGTDPELGELLWELTNKNARYFDYWKGWGEEAKELQFAIKPNEHHPEDLWVSFGTAPAGAFTTPEGREKGSARTMSDLRKSDNWTTYEQLAGRHQYLTHLLPEPVRSFFHPGSIREAAP